jgi:uncharacterized repeat protein (TIGR03803 family)
MKKILLILSLFAVSSALFTLSAQSMGKLWGLTQYGGHDSSGVIYNYNPVSGKVNTYPVFDSIQGGEPYYSNLILASDGNYYGTTYYGGEGYYGTLFKMTPAGVVTIIHNFSNSTTNGKYPYGGVIQGQDGALYGMTYRGGAYRDGTIYKCTTSGTFTLLHSFAGWPDGSFPYGSLVQAANGTFYGMTYEGGFNYDGTIFKMTPSGVVNIIHNFSNVSTDGGYPQGNLILSKTPSSSMYGMTTDGGTNNLGTIFKCDTNGNFTLLHSFIGGVTDGEYPNASLIQAGNDSLYGMTPSGGASSDGVIFASDTLGDFTLLHSFTGNPSDGSYPYGSLIEASNDTLYGLTADGGTANYGTLFSCSTSGNVSILHSFKGNHTDGESPYGTLIQGSNGKLYGMTYSGGQTYWGTIFRCSLSGNETVLHSFGVATKGISPNGAVVQGTDGNMYGVTYWGGTYDAGTIFKTTPAGVTTFLHSFKYDSTDGGYPEAALIQANDGNLYGMTPYGGKKGYGTIFRCTTTGTETVLYNFTDGDTDGAYPYGSLVQGKNGLLYGMTAQGGTFNDGTIFKSTLSGTEKVLHSFASGSTDGYYPLGSVTFVNDTTMYGLTEDGGTWNDGTIFKCDTAGNNFGLIHTFSGGSDGQNPLGSLVKSPNGKMYGTTEHGGNYTYGTIFSVTPSGNESIIDNFSNTSVDGAYPLNIIEGSDSNLYGLTVKGGTHNLGTMFRCDTLGNETVLMNFNDTGNGKYPSYISNIMEYASMSLSKVIQCSGYKITANVKGGGAGAYTYNWSNGGHTASISGLTTGGTYSVTVITHNGMTLTAGITIPAYTTLTSSITSFTRPCPSNANGAVALTTSGGTGAYTYAWNTAPVQTTISISGLTAGTYSVTIRDTSTCVRTASINLISDSLPVITTQPSTTSQSGCPGFVPTALSVGANGTNLTYQWYQNTGNSDVGGTAINGATSANYTPNTSTGGTYFYYCVVSNLCSPAAISNASGPIHSLEPDTIVRQFSDTLFCDASGATYQWLNCDNNDAPIAGATASKLQVARSGHYAVVVTQNGCTDTSACHFANLTGINNISVQASDVSIYPLPNNGHFAISMNGLGYKSMTIYDEMGKTVMTQSLQDENTNNILNVDMSNYAEGIYFARIITNSGTINKKIIIQR